LPSDDDEEFLKNAKPGQRGLKSLLDAVPDDFFDEDEESTGEGGNMMKMVNPGTPKRRGRPKTTKFSPKKPSKGARRSEIDQYKKNMKTYYNKQRLQKLKSRPKRPVTEFTCNHHPMLRTMAEVEKSRLSKGQTFVSRDILLLRTKEEANLRGFSIKVEKSDSVRFIVWSRDCPTFYVFATQSLTKAWVVKYCLVREFDDDPEWNGEIPGGKFLTFISQ